jgi:general secretion pathway protein H
LARPLGGATGRIDANSQTLNAPTRSGFTLIEILVVLFIVGLVSNAASVSIRNSIDGDAKNLAKQLYLQMRLAAEDAVLFNKQYGLDIDNDDGKWHYSWLGYDEFSERWTRTSSSGLKGGTLPQGAQISLEIDQSPVEFQSQLEDDQYEDNETGNQLENLWPDIVFLSSGEISPFRLSVNDTTEEEAQHRNIILSAEIGEKLKMESE